MGLNSESVSKGRSGEKELLLLDVHMHARLCTHIHTYYPHTDRDTLTYTDTHMYTHKQVHAHTHTQRGWR